MAQPIKKWGNSLAVRIPAAFADQLHWEENTEVELSVIDGKLVAEAVGGLDMQDIPVYDLGEMLAQIRPETFHPETDWGPPVGKEAW